MPIITIFRLPNGEHIIQESPMTVPITMIFHLRNGERIIHEFELPIELLPEMRRMLQHPITQFLVLKPLLSKYGYTPFDVQEIHIIDYDDDPEEDFD